MALAVLAGLAVVAGSGGATAQDGGASSVDGRIVVRPWVDDAGQLSRVEFGFRPGWGLDVRGGADGPDDISPPRRFLTRSLIDERAGTWLRSSELLIPDAEGSETGVRGRILVRAEADEEGRLTRIEFGFRPDWGADIRGTESGPDDIFPPNRFLTRRLIDRSAEKWLRSSQITVPVERPVETAEPSEGEVGAAGGVASAEDGATITVPAGAAAVGAEITARVATEEELPPPPDGATKVLSAWEFEVEGGITEPVTLSFPVPQDGEAWTVARYNGDRWELVPFVVENGMVFATPDSLSDFGVFNFGKRAVSGAVGLAGDAVGLAGDAADRVGDAAGEVWDTAKEGTRVVVRGVGGAVEAGYAYVKRGGEWVVELGAQMVRGIESAYKQLSDWIAQTVSPLDCEHESDNVLATLNTGQVLLDSCAEDEGEDEHRLRVKNMRRFWVQACPGPLVPPDLRRAPNLDVLGPLSNCALDGGTLLPSGREAEWISRLDSPAEIRATFSDSAALMTMIDWILAILGASDISGKIGHAVDIVASLRELPAVSQFVEHAAAGRIGEALSELGRILSSTTALKHISGVIVKAVPDLGDEFGGSVIAKALTIVELGRVPLKLYDLLSAHYSASGTFAAASFERTDLPTRAQDDEADESAGAFVAVSAGEEHSCGLRNSGVVECWGRNDDGQTDAPSGSFSAVSAGTNHSCGLRNSGAVECWGNNDFGQMDAPSGRFSAVSAGGRHSCGLRETGAVECWGNNDFGQTDAPSGRFSAVSAGMGHTCGLRETGAVECWRLNNFGQTDAPSGRFSTVSVGRWHSCGLQETGAVECWGRKTDAPSGRFSAVSAGGEYSCGLRETGAVECWGADWYGSTDAPGGRFSAVSAGGSSCGLRETGRVECWGSNEYGQTDAPGGGTVSVIGNEPPRCDDIADIGPLDPGELGGRIDPGDYCRDPENESLRYEATSSDNSVATAFISGGSLVVAAARASGAATITLTASDPSGLTGQASFRVTVSGNTQPEPVGSIPTTTIAVGYTNDDIRLGSYFRDADGDALDYSSSSSNSSSVSVRIRNGELIVTGRRAGSATITVTADDGNGGTATQQFRATAAPYPSSGFAYCQPDTIKVYYFDPFAGTKHHLDITGEQAERIYGASWWATIETMSASDCAIWPTGRAFDENDARRVRHS